MRERAVEAARPDLLLREDRAHSNISIALAKDWAPLPIQAIPDEMNEATGSRIDIEQMPLPGDANVDPTAEEGPADAAARGWNVEDPGDLETGHPIRSIAQRERGAGHRHARRQHVGAAGLLSCRRSRQRSA